MKPSDRAIAQAWREWAEPHKGVGPFEDDLIYCVEERARELDATAAPSDILPIDAGNAADWLDRASSKWEHGPAAINPADALRLRSIAALLRATAAPVDEFCKNEGHVYMDGAKCFNCGTAAPVVVGEVTDAMVSRALDAQPFIGTNRAKRVWQCFDLYEADAKLAMRAALTAALAGD